MSRPRTDSPLAGTHRASFSAVGDSSTMGRTIRVDAARHPLDGEGPPLSWQA
ncbi:hypothetical protein ACMHYB_22645 [Sorangium sp. So ce1128]